MSTTKKALFLLNGERVGFVLNYELKALRLFQRVWVWLERLSKPFSTWRLGRHGISYYVIPYSEKGFEDADELFGKIVKILKTAKEIRVTVGEMGHAMWERQELIDALKYAYRENQARIEIVHGPRVDKKTTQVFALAEQGMINLFRMPKYIPHHFMVATSLTGEMSVIDESIHDETLWAKDQTGELTLLFASKVRLYYVFDRSKDLAEYLISEFKRRKKTAVCTFEHPDIIAPQGISQRKLLVDTPLSLLPRHIFQPRSLRSDSPLDFPLKSLYKLNGWEMARLEKELSELTVGEASRELLDRWSRIPEDEKGKLIAQLLNETFSWNDWAVSDNFALTWLKIHFEKADVTWTPKATVATARKLELSG